MASGIYAPNGRPVDVDRVCLCLPRKRFDRSLVEAAAKAGAEVVPGAEAMSYQVSDDHAHVAVAAQLRPKLSHYAAAERWLRLPAGVNLIAWRVARSRELRRLLSDILNERRDPTELLSFQGFTRAAFRR